MRCVANMDYCLNISKKIDKELRPEQIMHYQSSYSAVPSFNPFPQAGFRVRDYFNALK
jgi:hypothetical protein